jgi:hypothetical protein
LKDWTALSGIPNRKNLPKLLPKKNYFYLHLLTNELRKKNTKWKFDPICYLFLTFFVCVLHWRNFDQYNGIIGRWDYFIIVTSVSEHWTKTNISNLFITERITIPTYVISSRILYYEVLILNNWSLSKCVYKHHGKSYKQVRMLCNIENYILYILIEILVPRRVDVRRVADRKNNFRIFITTWWKTCCTNPTQWDKDRKKNKKFCFS